MTWTKEQLGYDLRTKKWFAFPDVGQLGWAIKVKVEGEFADDVVEAANRIEAAPLARKEQ